MKVDLHSRSAFSFLRGASHPRDLAARAAELGIEAVALCDADGVQGAPRFLRAAREAGIRAIVGAELSLEAEGARGRLPVLVESRAGYRNLCRLLTTAQLRGHPPAVGWADLEATGTEGLIALGGDREGPVMKAW